MKEFALDPATLPEADILGHAQAGRLLRAERTTPPNGVPAFITCEDWKTMAARFGTAAEKDIDLFQALEKAVQRLLGHAAETLAKREAGVISATLSAQTDLFDEDGPTYLSFLRDSTHPVACVVIGTSPWADTGLS
ncbi:hypothetical protein [Asaia bogorensis]|uniref:hypothetical protein n=1 Tax=Asaia bogorensis TaxID=91915 RepID=UPI000EFD4D5E|nr:hypothetical protein [Asaia bogorensis]